MTSGSPSPRRATDPAITNLEADGVDTVIGTAVNPAGLTLAKSVPIARAAAFADPGLGTSPTWHGFCIDQAGIAFTDSNNDANRYSNCAASGATPSPIRDCHGNDLVIVQQIATPTATPLWTPIAMYEERYCS